MKWGSFKNFTIGLLFFIFSFSSRVFCQEYRKVEGDTILINLAFECCDCSKDANNNKVFNRQFSFCSDGYEQPFGFPTFVQLNLKDFLQSYNKPIYNLELLNDEFQINRYKKFDSIEKLIIKSNLVSFYDKRFKTRLNKRMRKIHKSKGNFDGKFYYGLFRLKIVVVPNGYQNKMLPVPKSSYMEVRKVFAYSILDILSIEPITREEYLESTILVN